MSLRNRRVERKYQKALKQLRRRLGAAAAVTVAIEGRAGLQEPWAARAGMQIVETKWDHDARHLHLVFRVSPEE